MRRRKEEAEEAAAASPVGSGLPRGAGRKKVDAGGKAADSSPADGEEDVKKGREEDVKKGRDEGRESSNDPSPSPKEKASSPTPKEPASSSASASPSASRRLMDGAGALTVSRFEAPDFNAGSFCNKVLFNALQKELDSRPGSDGQTSAPSSQSNRATETFTTAAEEAEEGIRLAEHLNTALHRYLREITALYEKTDALKQSKEVDAKRCEVKEKRRLTRIRAGLEETMRCLQEYEGRVDEAQAATSGIKQYLSQSHLRVQRGKTVHQLLRQFRMITSIAPSVLSATLKSLGAFRVTQRKAVTASWEINPPPLQAPCAFYNDVEVTDGGSEGAGTVQQKRTVKVVKKKKDGTVAGVTMKVKTVAKSLPAAFEECEAKAEQLAREAGLDPLFAKRSATEFQAEWCQRLEQLASTVQQVATNTENVKTFSLWLQQEFSQDLLHVIRQFNQCYHRNPLQAAHVPLGRALLKSMELISRLYATITSSSESLLTFFFSHAVNDLGVTLHADYSPAPFPGVPPPPAVSDVMAMDHYGKHMSVELPKSFSFLVARVKREMVVVEALLCSSQVVRQQLLLQVIEKVVKPFVMQQMKLAEKYREMVLSAEETLSPRSKRRSAARVLDALGYYLSVAVCLFSQSYVMLEELGHEITEREVSVLYPLLDNVFTAQRDRYCEQRDEMELLRRSFTSIREHYTRALYPGPDGVFDVREAHTIKLNSMISVMEAAGNRVRLFAYSREVMPYTLEIITAGLEGIAAFFEEELKKMLEAIQQDKENWRLRPKYEEEYLQPNKTESHHCGFHMLLFVQSGLVSVQLMLDHMCRPLLREHPRLLVEVQKLKGGIVAPVDEAGEQLINLCVSAILVRSLSILQLYQGRHDFLPPEPKANRPPKGDKKSSNVPGDDFVELNPPSSRACTLFCVYVTHQLTEAAEFIQHASNISSGNNGSFADGGAFLSSGRKEASQWQTEWEVTRAKAKSMTYPELLYGNGEPFSFVRTLGVCFYRGIAAHLKSTSANDRGALIYKQDVAAYGEAMKPLSQSPTLDGAVVGVLFQILRETSSLLLMPLEHIKDVKASGSLQLMYAKEKLAFVKIRQDVKAAFKSIRKK